MRRLSLVLGIALLAACEARIGMDKEAENAAPPQGSASASSGGVADAPAQAAKAKDGQLSIDAPGLQLKLDIPASLANKAEIEGNSGILYPGAALSGMHVEAREKANGEQSQVELRFTTSDAPAKVAAWYRDPARAGEFTVGSVRQTGAGFSILGSERGDGDPFDLSLNPRGGGTEGVLRLRDRS